MPSRARGPYLDNLLVAVVGLDALRGQGVTVAGPVGHHGEGFSHRLWATEAAARSGWPKSPGSSQTSTAAPSAASGSSSEAWGRARGDVSKPPPAKCPLPLPRFARTRALGPEGRRGADPPSAWAARAGRPGGHGAGSAAAPSRSPETRGGRQPPVEAALDICRHPVRAQPRVGAASEPPSPSSDTVSAIWNHQGPGEPRPRRGGGDTNRLAALCRSWAGSQGAQRVPRS